MLHYLLDQHVIREDIVDPHKRYAVKSYLNDDIVELMNEDSPESYLVQKIDLESNQAMFYDSADAFGEVGEHARPWQGTANELYSVLSEVGTRNAQDRFKKTCPSPKVLAAQLRHAAKSCPRRFQYSLDEASAIHPKKISGYAYWRIYPKCFIQPIEINISDCI